MDTKVFQKCYFNLADEKFDINDIKVEQDEKDFNIMHVRFGPLLIKMTQKQLSWLYRVIE